MCVCVVSSVVGVPECVAVVLHVVCVCSAVIVWGVGCYVVCV